METEKMYYFDKLCCICMNTSDLKHLFEEDSNGVSHYNKLTSSIAEMNFNEMNDQRLICGECCVTLNTVYTFRQMCLCSKTNLITYISQLQTSGHISGTVRVCLKDIKPDLIVMKNRGGSENEASNSFEGNNPQIKFQAVRSVENIGFSASVKEECATVNHVNEDAHSDVKVEDIEHQTMMEDYSECYTEFKIEIEEHPSEEVKEEPMSDTETPQDGSTSQADTGTSEEPKTSEATTIGTVLIQNTEKVNKGLHQCEICQMCFNGKNSLMNHMQTHSSERPYKCEICKKGFSYKNNFTKHMNLHSSKWSYECEICKKGFNHKYNLTVHMRIHSSEKQFECEICHKGFILKCNLAKHMKTHSSERPYECEICKKGFKLNYNLTEHMKIHSSERPYKCEICKKGFYNDWVLTEHMRGHSHKRPFECEICKKGFNYKRNLVEHMKTHSNERPYECKICKKGFNQKSNLTVHMRTHSSL